MIISWCRIPCVFLFQKYGFLCSAYIFYFLNQAILCQDLSEGPLPNKSPFPFMSKLENRIKSHRHHYSKTNNEGRVRKVVLIYLANVILHDSRAKLVLGSAFLRCDFWMLINDKEKLIPAFNPTGTYCLCE